MPRKNSAEVGAASATARDTEHVTDRGQRDRRPGNTAPHRAAAYDRDEAHARYGGIKWGAAFFGWLSANGLNVLLLALAGAAGAAFGLTQSSEAEARRNAGTIGITGAIVLLLILGLGYFAGGYVAGRMSRFDGARQGLAVWLMGLLVTVALAAAGVVFGAEYNVLSRLQLPRIPVDEGSATTGGLIALALVLLVTLAAAVLGGKSGERYHHKIDRVATHS